MKVRTFGKIITANSYDEKINDVVTGKKKVNRLAFLIDDEDDVALSGKVIHPYADKVDYVGPTDFSSFHLLEKFELDMDMTTYNNEERFRLFNITKVD